MIYSSDIETIKNDYKFIKDTANNLPVYAGIASPKKTEDIYGSAKHPSLEKQIIELKKLKVDGIVIFCWNWMEEFYDKKELIKIRKILK
ncbi:MAG TPA: hypothetical protein PLI27_06360 [Ignavibacteriales bacterium]|nr:hypothetical protein [Ignavibacteriales bacterium]HOL82020.1 hypothetical protein [Ignavibacteriales bacterium]HOM66100.1 hypothetical protein [Ignavibacteriales bacterium]HPD67681.1 hypothetical protein [Ignavibacteriales bacterium]HPP34155.1 hypothetical protein [Ignavibacteriales bacterium]